MDFVIERLVKAKTEEESRHATRWAILGASLAENQSLQSFNAPIRMQCRKAQRRAHASTRPARPHL